MWKKLIPKTIRGKIMVLTGTITLLITLLTTTVCFSVFQSFLRKNQIQSAQFSLQVVGNNIGADMKDIIYFSKWCCSNSSITEYLEAFKDQQGLPTASRDYDNLRPLAFSAYTRLKEEYYKYFNTRSNEYLSRVIISTADENNFLQMAASARFSPSYASRIIRQSSFFQELYDSDDYRWIGLVEDPFSNASNEQFLPIIRPVYDGFNSETIGWAYVEISSRLFTDYLKSYPMADDNIIFLTLGEKTYSYTSKGWNETAVPYTNPHDISQNTTLSKGTRVMSVTVNGEEGRILVERPIDGMNGWYLSQILSEQQFRQQNHLYTLLILVIWFSIASLGVLLAFLLNKIIMEPIRMLSSKINDISKGNFSKDTNIEWNHELGEVGRGINSMSEDINTLLEKKVADEKQKKDLEYQILQSQINPHFLYNTLNSIKWMATIQNATGIADMTTALARLMKNVSKGTSSMIPLKEELALVKDYFIIQQYRYGGSVTMEYQIESDDLYECEIHRFSLQPIIENALFHGIEPTGAAGKIIVSAQTTQVASQKALKISITDNGIGMTQETIHQILYEDNETQNKTEFFRHVGINNVNKRLQYDFGPEYGITITSQPGQFTTMTLLMPYVPAYPIDSSGGKL